MGPELEAALSRGALAGAAAVPKFELLTPEDIEALPDLEWLIEGVLPKPGLVVLYGERPEAARPLSRSPWP